MKRVEMACRAGLDDDGNGVVEIRVIQTGPYSGSPAEREASTVEFMLYPHEATEFANAMLANARTASALTRH